MNFTKIICYLGRILFLFKSGDINDPCIRSPKKILLTRSGAIGDVVMTTPLIKSIRKRYPRAEISYLVGNWSKKILENNPDLNRIISFPDEIVYKKKLGEIIKLIRRLRKEKFDLAFVLDKSYHWGILAFLAGIKRRIGFNRTGICGEEGFAYNFNVAYDGSKNERDYNLNLAELVNADITEKNCEIYLSLKDKNFAEEFFHKNKINGQVIGLTVAGAKNPGQEMALKRWPLKNYLQLIRLLLQIKTSNIFLFAGPKETEGIQEIYASLHLENISTKKVFDLSQTSITEKAALMKRCDLIIAHDSGPLHIASAMGAKTITLFGPTPARRFAPKDAIIFQKEKNGCPCYDIYGNYKKCQEPTCMSSISPEEIYQKTQSLI